LAAIVPGMADRIRAGFAERMFSSLRPGNGSISARDS
jgi:hypothetical protein